MPINSYHPQADVKRPILVSFPIQQCSAVSQVPGAICTWEFRGCGHIRHTLRTQYKFSSVQLLSCVQLFVTPWTAARQASLSITISWSLPKLMFIESMVPSNHLILCCPLLLLPSIFPGIRVFSNELAVCIMWSEHWSFSFSIIPFNEYSGLISFRMDWLDLLAVQGTVKSLLQHHSSKASILRHSAFFIIQLSHLKHDYWRNKWKCI